MESEKEGKKGFPGWASCLIGCVSFLVISLIFVKVICTNAFSSIDQMSCESNLKQIGTALSMYSEDNYGKYPSAAAWCDDLSPYLKSKRIFHCHLTDKYGYAINERLSGTTEKKRKNNNDPIFFETPILKRNAHQVFDKHNLAYRHGVFYENKITNVVYPDGHAETIMAP